MIFAVAGTQLPFSRMMTALDAIAGRTGIDVIAQTADPAFVAQAMDARAFIPPAEFNRLFAEAELVVAHAGMGVIIEAAGQKKPLILMGRKAALGEHRNDHQLATVRRFTGMPGLAVVEDEAELEAAIAAPRHGFDLAGSPSRAELIATIRDLLA